MDIFQSFLKRIEQGELDPGDNFTERIKQFANELMINTDKDFLTGKQAAVLWLHHLKRLGYRVEIPDTK